MALPESLNVGQKENDGTGDRRRDAFVKIKVNLDYLEGTKGQQRFIRPDGTEVMQATLTLDDIGAASDDEVAVKLDKEGDASTAGSLPTGVVSAPALLPRLGDRFGVLGPIIQDFKGAWDGTKDDTAALLDGTDWVRRKGGRLHLPSGTGCISAPITCTDWSNIELLGTGTGSGAGSGTNAQDGSVIKWIGAAGGRMIDWQSPNSARPYLTSGSRLRGIALDGNGLADTGLYIRGLYNCGFGLKIRNVRAYGVDMDIYIGGGADLQHNWTDYLDIDLGYPASVNATGVRIGPGSSYNDSHHNEWRNWRCIHQAGVGFDIGNADTDRFFGLQAQYPVDGSGTRTGLGLALRASPNAMGPGGVTQSARSLSFYHVSVPSGMKVFAGSFGLPSYGCMIYGYVQESGEPDPIVEAGASLEWHSTRGEWHVKKIYPYQQVWKSTGDFEVLFQNQAGATVGYLGTDGIFSGVPTDGVRFRNDKGGGIGAGNSPAILWDTSNNITFPSIRSFASNSAARSASPPVPVGALYFNTGSGSLSLAQ